MPFVGAGGTLAEDNSKLFWDDTNNRLGIGTNTPTSPLAVNLSQNASLTGTHIRIENPDASAQSSIGFFNNATQLANIRTDFAGSLSVASYAGALAFYTGGDADVSTVKATITNAGNFGIGSGYSSPTQQFDILGKFQVDTNGNVLKINNVATSFPAAQGAASTYLKNDGAGVLTWDDPVFSGTTGSVPFVGAGGTLAEDNSNLFWDDTNNRLGIGTTAPAVPLDVAVDATITTVGTLQSKIGSETTAAGLYIGNDSTTKDTYIESAKTFGGGYQSTALKINTIKGGPIYIGQGTPNFTGSLELVNGNFAVTNGGIVMGNSESNITNKSSATAPAGAGAAFYVTKILVGNISFLNKTDGFACNFSCASPTLITGSCVPVGPAVAQCTAPGVNTGIECAYSGVFGTMVCNNWLGHTFAWSALDTGVTQ